jgi:hypothetical protein
LPLELLGGSHLAIFTKDIAGFAGKLQVITLKIVWIAFGAQFITEAEASQ